MSDTPPKQVFELRKIYLKDVSFESPNSPAVFTNQNVNPKIDLQIGITQSALDGNFHDATLSITATAKVDEKTVFLIEVKQAGIFEISGMEADKLKAVLGVACPNTLLPFAREALAGLAQKGGFPQLLINPINFEAIYHQKQKVQAEAAQAEIEKQDAVKH